MKTDKIFREIYILTSRFLLYFVLSITEAHIETKLTHTWSRERNTWNNRVGGVGWFC